MPLPNTRVVHPNRITAVSGILDETKPQLATIERRTYAKSATGGETETLTTVASNRPVRLRVQGRRAIAIEAADRATEAARWELSFEVGEDVKAFDRILVGARTFDVLEGGVESYEPEVRVLCVEVIS